MYVYFLSQGQGFSMSVCPYLILRSVLCVEGEEELRIARQKCVGMSLWAKMNLWDYFSTEETRERKGMKEREEKTKVRGKEEDDMRKLREGINREGTVFI